MCSSKNRDLHNHPNHDGHHGHTHVHLLAEDEIQSLIGKKERLLTHIEEIERQIRVLESASR